MITITRLAIVNRGEPAVRALAAVAELNWSRPASPITTVVVHTDPDVQAWFVREADETVSLGPATYVDPADGNRKSRYLDEPAVIDALLRARVDAVWVGWGFLAERASFARLCEEVGITFVGPSSETIATLGNKIAAKRIAESVGVPVVPWSGEPVQQPARAAAHARRLGYPLLVKAATGGGGRGIRIVRDRSELANALASARAEAALAFDDPTVFLEQLIPARRHVEVQIIGDNYGNIWAVGVRDCTIQRRHQKVVEESSSPALDAAAGTRHRRRGNPYRRRGGLPQCRHRRVPRRSADRRVPVHGGQHQTAGRASGHRANHRAGPGQAAAVRCLRWPPARPASAGSGARYRGEVVRRGPRQRLRPGARPAGRVRRTRRPGDPGRRRCTPGRRRGARVRLDDREDRRLGPGPG